MAASEAFTVRCEPEKTDASQVASCLAALGDLASHPHFTPSLAGPSPCSALPGFVLVLGLGFLTCPSAVRLAREAPKCDYGILWQNFRFNVDLNSNLCLFCVGVG